jgi:DNA-binding transcriptional regulator/RsmH inhibitor MraZ
MVSFALKQFGMASLVEWDKQWRVLIPDKTLTRTGISKQITLVGAGDHLQLWNRADWESQFDELLTQDESSPPPQAA